jgi:hypothetical protein
MKWSERNLYEEVWGFVIQCSCGGVARVKDGYFAVGSNPRIFACTECGMEHIFDKR